MVQLMPGETVKRKARPSDEWLDNAVRLASRRLNITLTIALSSTCPAWRIEVQGAYKIERYFV
jgi:hypothetical protein